MLDLLSRNDPKIDWLIHQRFANAQARYMLPLKELKSSRKWKSLPLETLNRYAEPLALHQLALLSCDQVITSMSK